MNWICLLPVTAMITLDASAQAWPQRAVRLVVPNAPGGGSDTVARVLAERLTRALGQQVVVENRAGAGGRQAAEFVARSPADGYTLLLVTGATLITARALRPLGFRSGEELCTDCVAGEHGLFAGGASFGAGGNRAAVDYYLQSTAGRAQLFIERLGQSDAPCDRVIQLDGRLGCSVVERRPG